MEKFTNPEFISVGSLAKTIGSPKREQTDLLAGETYVMYGEKGYAFELTFLEGKEITYEREGEKAFTSAANIYLIADDVFFIDFINTENIKESHSLILDLEEGIATHMIGTLPSKEEYSYSLFERAEKKLCLSPVALTWEHLAVNTPFDSETKRHEQTTDLVGKRFLWHYTEDETYEHNYLSESFYTWFCHSGSEKGLCDTDRCFYFKIREGLYYFIWIEKIIPTLGMVVEDAVNMKTWGKLYGYKGYEQGEIVNCQMAAEGEQIVPNFTMISRG